MCGLQAVGPAAKDVAEGCGGGLRAARQLQTQVVFELARIRKAQLAETMTGELASPGPVISQQKPNLPLDTVIVADLRFQVEGA